jgi:hypothetical protein
MPQPIKAEVTFGILHRDKLRQCTKQGLILPGQAFGLHINEVTSCQIECMKQLEQDSNSFLALLKERSVTLQCVHGMGALNPPQLSFDPSARRAGGFSPMAARTVTNKRICKHAASSGPQTQMCKPAFIPHVIIPKDR